MNNLEKCKTFCGHLFSYNEGKKKKYGCEKDRDIETYCSLRDSSMWDDIEENTDEKDQ